MNELTPIKDLLLPAELNQRAEDARNTFGSIEEKARALVTEAAHLGFQLITLQADLGLSPGGARKQGAKVAPWSWKQLCEKILGRSYRTAANYMAYARRVAKAIPELEILLKKDFNSLEPAEAIKLGEILTALPDHPELCHLAADSTKPELPPAPATNNPDGTNGHDSPPLSPEQRRAEATIKLFGSADLTRPKPGSFAWAIFKQNGDLRMPDGSEDRMEWQDADPQAIALISEKLKELTEKIATHVEGHGIKEADISKLPDPAELLED